MGKLNKEFYCKKQYRPQEATMSLKWSFNKLRKKVLDQILSLNLIKE